MNRAIASDQRPNASASNGHRADQPVVLVHHGHRDQVVGGQPAGDLGQRGVRVERVDVPLRHPTEQLGRGLAEQSLEVHGTQVAPGGRGHRRAGDEDLGGHRRGELRLADPGQRLGYGGVGREHDRLGGHHRAGGTRLVVQQPPDRVGLLRLHQVQQHLLLRLGQLGQQVGGVVRVHLLQHVGGAFRLQRGDDLDLVVLGQLLQHVGEPLVVQRGGHLDPPAVGQVLQHVGQVGRAHLVQHGEQVGRAAPVGRADQPGHPGPLQLVEMPAAAQPAGHLARRDPGQNPFAGTVSLHRHVDHGGLPPAVGDRHPPVQQLLQHQQLARALLEPAQVERAGVEHHRVRLDRGDPADRQEDPPAQRHLRDQPDHPGRQAAAAQAGHRVPDPADLVAIGVEDRQAGETGHVHPGRRGHLLSLDAT